MLTHLRDKFLIFTVDKKLLKNFLAKNWAKIKKCISTWLLKFLIEKGIP